MVYDCETGSYSSIFYFLLRLSVETVIYIHGYETGSYFSVCFGSVSKQRSVYLAMKVVFIPAFVLFMLGVKTAIYAHGYESGSYSSICFVQAQCQNSDLRARLSRIHADSYVPDLAPLTVTSPVASPRVERVSVTSLNVCMMMITLVKP